MSWTYSKALGTASLFFLFLYSCKKTEPKVSSEEGSDKKNQEQLALAESFNPFTKFRLVWFEDPARNVKLSFVVDTKLKEPISIHFGLQDHGTQVKKYPYEKVVKKSDLYMEMSNYFYQFKGLLPDTKYFFVVSSGKYLSRRFWFRTAPDKMDKKLSFVLGGDSRNNRSPRRKANILVSKLRPDAVLFGGDFTDRSSPKQWKNWFDDWQLSIPKDGQLIPLIVARGNHEPDNRILARLFDVPEHLYYATSIGGKLLKVITLNSEAPIRGNQTIWLKNILKKSDHRFKIVQYHKPMRPHVRRKSEGHPQYDAWATLFYKHGVEIVMESDSHAVKSTWPIRPSYDVFNDEGFVRDDKKGTVYLGEGCWGAPLREADDNKSWTRSSGSFNQFKWVFVDQEKLEVRTIIVENASYVEALNDSNRFQIPKRIRVWDPPEGDVIVIRDNNANVVSH